MIYELFFLKVRTSNRPRIRFLRPEISREPAFSNCSDCFESLLIFYSLFFFGITFLRLLSILWSNFCTPKKSPDFERFRQLTSDYGRFLKVLFRKIAQVSVRFRKLRQMASFYPARNPTTVIIIIISINVSKKRFLFSF
jgi:hypothetical protein